MIVVALDTCFDACSVAVADIVADRLTLLASERQFMATGHAEVVVPMLDRVMVASGRRPTTIAHVMVTHGPGTFAGTRVGVAVSRALQTATQATASSVSSLEAIAGAVFLRPADRPIKHPVAVVIDARRGQFYFQIVSPADGPLTPAMLVTADEASALLPAGPVAVVGNGGAAVVAAANRAEVSILAEADSLPDARSMVATLTRLPGSSERVTPLYLREADTTRPKASGVSGDRPQ